METSAEQRYCRECGSLIEPGAGFCYSCGAELPADTPVPGFRPEPESATYDPAAARAAMAITLRIAAFSISKIIMIWVLLSLIMGTVSIAISPYMIDLLEETYGITYSGNQVLTEGMCLIMSGVAALLSSILLRKLRAFWVCFISCIFAALASYPGMGGFVGVITAAIGIYVSMMILRCRPVFGTNE